MGELFPLRQTEESHLEEAPPGRNLRKVTQKRRGNQKNVFSLTHPVPFSAAILKGKHYFCGCIFSPRLKKTKQKNMVRKRRDGRGANDLGNAGHFPGLKNKTKPRREP